MRKCVIKLQIIINNNNIYMYIFVSRGPFEVALFGYTCVQRTTEGKLETVIYQKPIHTDKYLSYNSRHPRSHKKSVVIT